MPIERDITRGQFDHVGSNTLTQLVTTNRQRNTGRNKLYSDACECAATCERGNNPGCDSQCGESDAESGRFRPFLLEVVVNRLQKHRIRTDCKSLFVLSMMPGRSHTFTVSF